MNLQPYSGIFDREAASHLLRRSTFATSAERINEAVDLGLTASIERLFESPPALGEPLNFNYQNDPNVPIGASWVRAPYSQTLNFNGYRTQSLKAFRVQFLLNSGFNIQSRMWLFWHNHFSAKDTTDRRAAFDYVKLLYDYATGNFKDLIEKITIDVSMLRFLNGYQNVKQSPNENYARELLELYTLGKGPQVGSGDYTNYTEDDIRTFARALTGWRTTNLLSKEAGQHPSAFFRLNRHDVDPKTLSHRFNNKELTVVGEEAYKEVVNVVFEHQAAALYVCRKLYRFFVYYKIDDQVEQAIIQPLAQILRDSNFEIAPVLRTLLSSEHFFEQRFRGVLIKSPVDFIADCTLGIDLEVPDEIEKKYLFYRLVDNNLNTQLMSLNVPPSVAGYPAWHQSPSYHRLWINSTTLGSKALFSKRACDLGLRISGNTFVADLLTFIAKFDNPTNPNDLVSELAWRLLSINLEQPQIDALKDILIPGLPDFEWTIEYGDYLENPDDQNLENSILRKLQSLFTSVMVSPEFHLY